MPRSRLDYVSDWLVSGESGHVVDSRRRESGFSIACSGS